MRVGLTKLFFFLLTQQTWGDYRPCPSLSFMGNMDKLGTNEKPLVCPSQQSAAWSQIPLAQRKSHLVRILQDRGFHSPTFRTRGDLLEVDVGSKSRLSEIKTKTKHKLELRWQRSWLNAPLTPQLLNEIEAQAKEQMRNRGFPCVEAKTSVPNPTSGKVIVSIRSGKKSSFAGKLLKSSVQTEMAPWVLSRHYAFSEGTFFRSYLLAVTKQRLEQADILSGAFYSETCEQGKLTQLTLHGQYTPPRSVSLGLGIDTEGLLKARANWRHARLGDGASPVSFSAYGSRNRQQLLGTFKWFSFRSIPHFFLNSSLSLKRQSEKHFEMYQITTKLLPSLAVQGAGGRHVFSLGPSLERLKTTRGQGKGDLLLPIVETSVSYLSHLLEFGIAHPHEGHSYQVKMLSTQRSLGSDLSATQLEAKGKTFFFFDEHLPPRFIFALRGSLATTSHTSGPLPSQFRFFLGGSDSLRGYSRLELPADGVGALTKAYASAEFRVSQIFPWKLEPIVFFDAGKLSDKSFSLSGALFSSPGMGIRWLSPIGLVRATLAKGITWGDIPSASHKDHWQFYLGLGETF